MASNMSVVVLYDNMDMREVTAPDLSYQDGVVFQDEYIGGLGDPDGGVWWERTAVIDSMATDVGDDLHDGWRKVFSRTWIIEPEEASSVLGLWVRGALTLVRDDEADNLSRLTNVSLKQLLASQAPDDADEGGEGPVGPGASAVAESEPEDEPEDLAIEDEDAWDPGDELDIPV